MKNKLFNYLARTGSGLALAGLVAMQTFNDESQIERIQSGLPQIPTVYVNSQYGLHPPASPSQPTERMKQLTLQTIENTLTQHREQRVKKFYTNPDPVVFSPSLSKEPMKERAGGHLDVTFFKQAGIITPDKLQVRCETWQSNMLPQTEAKPPEFYPHDCVVTDIFPE